MTTQAQQHHGNVQGRRKETGIRDGQRRNVARNQEEEEEMSLIIPLFLEE